MQTGYLEGVGLGLIDRKYSLVRIKVIEIYGKSPQLTETNVCVCVCGHVYVVYEDTNLYNDMGIT